MTSNARKTAACVALSAISLAASHAALAHEEGHTPPPWQQASAWPDRIVATFETDPATSFAVSWRTAHGIDRPVARIAEALPAPRFDRAADELEARTERVRLDRTEFQGRQHRLDYPLNPARASFHSVNFTGLEPDTLYAYQVCGARAHCSEWFQIRTAPASGAPLRFVYLGDAQNGVMTHFARVLRAAWAAWPQADFIVHAGDLVDHASRDLEWAGWFRAGGFIHAMTPAVPVAGNHEYDKLDIDGERRRVVLSRMWRPQFRLPVVEDLPGVLRETVYAVDFGKTLQLFVLDTQSGLFEVQAEWLDAQLAASGADWNVVAMHHPVFSTAGERDNPELRAAVLPVLRSHGVALVLQGHDHTYSRGRDTGGVQIERDATGTVFVTSVSGAKQYRIKQQRWDDYADDGAVLDRAGENTQFYQLIEIDGERLDYAAYTATGERYDRFALTRGEDGRLRLVETGGAGAERGHDNTADYGGVDDLNAGSVLEQPPGGRPK